MAEKKIDKVLREILNKMFEIAGHNLTIDDVIGSEEPWFDQYTMTQSQQEEWETFSVELIRKKYKFPKERARKEFGWLSLCYGLKIEKYI